MIKDWFEVHWKKVLVNGLILSAFLAYAFFLAGPLFSKFEVLEGESPLAQVSLPSPTNNIQYFVGRLSASDYSIEIEGWAYIEGESDEDSQTYIVLKSAGNTYVFEASSLAWSGFVSVIPLRKIKEGGYNLGLYIKKVGIEALQYTDKGFVKSGNTIKVFSP
jgi:hypothetical protein